MTKKHSKKTLELRKHTISGRGGGRGSARSLKKKKWVLVSFPCSATPLQFSTHWHFQICKFWLVNINCSTMKMSATTTAKMVTIPTATATTTTMTGLETQMHSDVHSLACDMSCEKPWKAKMPSHFSGSCNQNNINCSEKAMASWTQILGSIL